MSEAENLREVLRDARLFVDLVRVHWPLWHDDDEQGAEAEDCLSRIDTVLNHGEAA